MHFYTTEFSQCKYYYKPIFALNVSSTMNCRYGLMLTSVIGALTFSSGMPVWHAPIHIHTRLPACLLKIRMQAHTQTCIVLVAGSLRHAEFIKFCIDKPLAGTAAAFKSSQQVAASSCFHPPSHQVYIICIVHMEASRHYKVKREMGISAVGLLIAYAADRFHLLRLTCRPPPYSPRLASTALAALELALLAHCLVGIWVLTVLLSLLLLLLRLLL